MYEGSHTVVLCITLLLHCCYTVVTLFYTVVTLLLDCVTKLLHCCYTVVAMLLHCCTGLTISARACTKAVLHSLKRLHAIKSCLYLEQGYTFVRRKQCANSVIAI
jgi:hypothetical protein